MTFPVEPVVKPADLEGVENGHLGNTLLVPVSGGGRLHHLAARAWVALVMNAAHHADMHMTYTYGGTYRSYAQQETLFRSRYAVGGTGGGCKNWDSDGNGTVERWCKTNAKFATAATPGTSNHGWGLAIDTAYDSDLADGVGPDDAAYIKSHPGFQWLLDNAHRFGFSWELQSEPWHIRYVTGDAIPQAVIDWEIFSGTSPAPSVPESPAPAPAPAPWPPYSPPTSYSLWPLATNKQTLHQTAARNDQDPYTVTYLQDVLKFEASQRVTTDGWFGSQTELAVRNVQKFFGLTVDGWVGPKTWAVIDMLASR